MRQSPDNADAGDNQTAYVTDLRFYEELNEFLPQALRKKTIQVESREPRSVKDLIESLGVPHTEVDLVLVDGKAVSFDYLVHEPARVSVYPKFETLDISGVSQLGRQPLRSIRFLADVHLGKLVRILRLLGFDCIYNQDWGDEILARKSAEEQRVLLTRDRGLLKRAIVTHGIFIRSEVPAEQAREVVRRLSIRRLAKPFARCVRCNGNLYEVPKAAALGLVPAKTYKYIHRYLQCDACGKVYWKGTHWKHLQHIVNNALDIDASI